MNLSRSSTSSRRRQYLRAIFEKRSASVYGLMTVFFCGLLGATQILPNELTVGVVALIVIYEFQKRLDQGVPLLQLTALIATLQWLVGPIMNYNTPYEYGKYQMYVDQERYFEFALPATCVYVAVMLVVGASVKQKALLQQLDRKNFLTIGFVLNVISIAAMFAAPRFSGGLQFALFLVTQFRYVGALYFLFSRHELRFLFVAFSMAPLMIISLNTGMFHDLLLWMAILFCYWFAQRKWSFGMKILALSASAAVLFSIQAVKQEYRAQLRRGTDPSLVKLMTEYVTPGGRAFEEDILTQVVIRLNQGWIISSVIAHVPDFEPFAEGETLKDAAISALAPPVSVPRQETSRRARELPAIHRFGDPGQHFDGHQPAWRSLRKLRPHRWCPADGRLRWLFRVDLFTLTKVRRPPPSLFLLVAAAVLPVDQGRDRIPRCFESAFKRCPCGLWNALVYRYEFSSAYANADAANANPDNDPTSPYQSGARRLIRELVSSQLSAVSSRRPLISQVTAFAHSSVNVHSIVAASLTCLLFYTSSEDHYRHSLVSRGISTGCAAHGGC
ncbi:MAG UNVERIFIED_CONTAM: hypothetical protein LVR18_21615 [Planctomycetaceae bacterium]|jgi:hypothetical protein